MPRTPRPVLMALLADVKRNPDDLTPWLVLCDWLEEQDGEADRARGEYCRLCFDKLGRKTFASDWEKGERRRHLYRTHHQAWLGPLAGLGAQIEKGLLSWRVQDLSPYAKQLGEDPEAWAWVGTLGFWNGLTKLMRSTSQWLVEELNTLEINRNLGGEAQVEKFANWPALRRIPRLSLELETLTRGKARSLADSPYLADVRDLTLRIISHRWPHPGSQRRRRGRKHGGSSRIASGTRCDSSADSRPRIIGENNTPEGSRWTPEPLAGSSSA